MAATARVIEAGKIRHFGLSDDTPWGIHSYLQLAREHGFEETSYQRNPEPTDCILCGLCVRMCEKMGNSAIST